MPHHAPRLIVAAALPALLFAGCDQQPPAEQGQRDKLREGVRLTSTDPTVRDVDRLLDADQGHTPARLKQIDDALAALGEAAQKGDDATRAAALRTIAAIFIERAQHERHRAALAALGIIKPASAAAAAADTADTDTDGGEADPRAEAQPVVAGVFSEAEALTRIAAAAAREARTAGAVAGAGEPLEQALAAEVERLRGEQRALTEGEGDTEATNRLEELKTGAEMEAKAAREQARAERERAAAMARDLIVQQREQRQALAARAEQMSPGEAAEARRKLDVQQQEQYLEMLDRRAEAQKAAGALDARARQKEIEAADAAARLAPLQAKLAAVNAGLRATEATLDLLRTGLDRGTLASIEADVDAWWDSRESPLGEAKRAYRDLVDASQGGEMSAELGRRMLTVEDRVRDRLIELRLDSLAAAQARAKLAGESAEAARLAIRLNEAKSTNDPSLLFSQDDVRAAMWDAVVRAAAGKVARIEAQAGAFKAHRQRELVDERLAEAVKQKIAQRVRQQHPQATEEELAGLVDKARAAVGDGPQQFAFAARLAHAAAAVEANRDAAAAIADAVARRFAEVHERYRTEVDARLEEGLAFADDAVTRLDAAADVPGASKATIAADRAAAHLERLVLLADRAAAADRLMRAAEQAAATLNAAGLDPQPMQGQPSLGEHAIGLRASRDQYVADAQAAAAAVATAAAAAAASEDAPDYGALASDHLDRLTGVVVVGDVLAALSDIDRAVTSAVSAESAREAVGRVDAAAVAVTTWPEPVAGLADRLVRYEVAGMPLRERRAEAVTTAVQWHLTMLTTLANALSGGVGSLPEAADRAVDTKPAAGGMAVTPASVTAAAEQAKQALERFAAAAEAVDAAAAREALGGPLPLYVADVWSRARVGFDATPPPLPEFVRTVVEPPTDTGPDLTLVELARAQEDALSDIQAELYVVGDVTGATAAAEEVAELTTRLEGLIADYDEAATGADAAAIGATQAEVGDAIAEAIRLVEAARNSMIGQPEYAAVLREPLDRLVPLLDRIKRQRADAAAAGQPTTFDEPAVDDDAGEGF